MALNDEELSTMLHPHRIQLLPVEPERGRWLAQSLGLPETLANLLIQRGLREVEEARSFLQDEAHQVCADPMLFRDMGIAVDLLEDAIAKQETIFIHGDYDVDGICSTVLLVEGLQALGANLEHHVPDRFSEGYGVSLRAVEAAADRGARVLLTCDCGSSSHAAIEAAHARGMRVVVTDHHSLPATLPEPDAFLNPHFADCPYPFKEMCGTAVAYKLICGLCQKRGLPWPTHFLDLVAVATIADVMPLLGENRAMVRSGLRELSELRRPGFRALAQISGLEQGPWDSFAVGFGLGPRLNAAGRLEHAGLGVKLLLCQEDEEARKLASYLDKLNRDRREIESRMRKEVEERLLQDPSKLDLGVVVEGGENWHQGVVGITASRIVDKYGVPAFIMGRAGDIYKGSARAADNVDLHQAMQLCSDVFVKFGGHARAAGFSVSADRVDEMRTRLAAAIQQVKRGPAPIKVDLELDLRSADLNLAQQLKLLEPLGEGNRAPLFLARRVRLDHIKAMGKSEEHFRCRLVQGGSERKGVAFRLAREREHILEKHLYYDITFELQEDSWDGLNYACVRIHSLLEPQPQVFAVLKRAQEWRRSEDSPRLIDGRNVLSRRHYIEALLEQNCDPLVVVRDGRQGEKVRELFPGPLPVHAYEELPHGYSDVLLLYPPGTLDQLQHPALNQAQRIHVLFGSRELQQELHRWLDRSRLEAIWRTLKRHAQGGRIEETWLGSSMERDLQAVKACPTSLQRAVEVFEELQLVERKPGAWVLRSPSGRRLEESRRYQEMCRGREQFMQLVQRFDERHLRLEERLAGA